MNNQWTFEFRGDLQSSMVLLAMLCVVIAGITHAIRLFVGWRAEYEFNLLIAPFEDKAARYRQAAIDEQDSEQRLRLYTKARDYEDIVRRLRDARR